MEINLRTDFKSTIDDLGGAPAEIERAARIAINKAAERVRVDSGGEISDNIKPRRGAKREIKSRIKTVKARGYNLTATIYFNERGFGIEKTAKATIRKVRGKGGRYTVRFRGRQINKAFRVGGKSAILLRSGGKLERLFSYTLLQEARRADVFTTGQQEGLRVASEEFVRQLRLFK